MEEVLDSAEPTGLGANAFDKAGCIRVDSPLGVRRAPRLIQQRGRERLVGRRVGSTECASGACIRGAGHLRI